MGPPRGARESRSAALAEAGGEPLIARGLDVSAGGKRILSSVGFHLLPGELCALIGPSGAGKSTLIKVLLGLRSPDRGEVRLGSGGLADSGPLGYVPQDDALHRSLRVECALGFAAELRLPEASAEERSQRISEVCRQVGLSEARETRISKLSGGQRKRVSVAMELLTQPSVLILDEPTSGLDPGLEARMMRLFATVARRGRILLVATHAMQSLELCQALLLLVQGHVAYFGAPAEAPSFFGVQSYEAIFQSLPKRKPSAWAAAWRKDPRSAAFGRRTRPPGESR